MDSKASMECEGRELDEEQKQLKLRAKTLTEKIIQELKKRNSAKQEAVNRLHNKVKELESELNSLSNPDVPDTTNKNNDESQEKAETVEAFEESLEETIDDTVSVSEVAEEIEVGKDSKDKRKRKFF